MERDTRGQSGLDRLLLFVVFVVALVAVTPFVFELGGLDLRGGETASADPSTPDELTAEGSIVVLGVTGDTAGFGGEEIGAVRVVVTTTGTEPLDTAAWTATWLGPNGKYRLLPTGQGGVGTDGVFRVDGSEDRAVLIFDLGLDDADGAEEFSRRLNEGDTVTLSLTTSDGTTTTVTLDVPQSLGDEETVQLRTSAYRPNSR